MAAGVKKFTTTFKAPYIAMYNIHKLKFPLEFTRWNSYTVVPLLKDHSQQKLHPLQITEIVKYMYY